MEFLPLEICRKLTAIGYKTESGFVWINRLLKITETNEEPIIALLQNVIFDWEPNAEILCPAFTPWDFIGTSEQARDNARILWGDEIATPDPKDVDFGGISGQLTSMICLVANPGGWKKRREDCINSDDAVAYIVEAIERKS